MNAGVRRWIGIASIDRVLMLIENPSAFMATEIPAKAVHAATNAITHNIGLSNCFTVMGGCLPNVAASPAP